MHHTTSVFLLLLCIVSLVPAGNAFGADRITMAKEIPFKEMARVPNAVRTECDLGNKLHDYIQANLEMNEVEVNSVEDLSKARGKVLSIEISDVRGFGGGGWSGPKFMDITGSLTQGGKKIGSFSAGDHSVGGGFSGFVFKGSCYIFDLIAQSLARDVGTWYANGHQMGVRLGN